MKRLLISITILTSLIIPKFTFGSDLDEFKAKVEKFIQAFNSMNADTIAQMTHPGLVICEADDPFPYFYPTADTFKEALQSWFSALESLNFVIFNPQYKVVGNTGVMWGYTKRMVIMKGGSRDIDYFVKSGGKWRVLTNHFSKFPLDDLK